MLACRVSLYVCLFTVKCLLCCFRRRGRIFVGLVWFGEGGGGGGGEGRLQRSVYVAVLCFVFSMVCCCYLSLLSLALMLVSFTVLFLPRTALSL